MHTPNLSKRLPLTEYTDITLRYIDAGSLPGNTTTLNHALIKVWYITPSSNAMISYYPRVYVEDDNGKAWGWPLYVI